LFDFLALLDQSVGHHPYPQHTAIAKDRLNDEGIPIFEYVLDGDFDLIRDKGIIGIPIKILLLPASSFRDRELL
jgi:hypothetical protein